MKRSLLLCAVAVWVVSALTSCATTTLKTAWKDDAYQRRLSKILVIGVAEGPAVRRLYEDEFVRQLAGFGTQGLASYTILPSLQEIQDREAVAARGKELGADAILVTRLVDQKTVREYYSPAEQAYIAPPRYRRGWYRHYSASYSYVTTPTRVVERELVLLETQIYDLRSDKLIWSALSETLIEGASDDAIRSVIGELVKDLAQKRLLES